MTARQAGFRKFPLSPGGDTRAGSALIAGVAAVFVGVVRNRESVETVKVAAVSRFTKRLALRLFILVVNS